MLKTIITLLCITLGFHSVSFADDAEWKPFLLEDGHVKLKIKIEGIAGYAIIDSGSPRSAINKAFIRANNLDADVLAYSDVTGLFDKRRRKLYEAVNLQVANESQQFNLVEVSFGPARNAVLLGVDFLKDYAVDIDYPNQRLKLHPKDDMPLDELSNIVATKQRGSGELIIRLSLNDEDERWLILDTGHSGGILMEKRVAAQNQWFRRYSSRSVLVRGVNAMGYHNVVKLPVVGKGGYRVENVDVEFPDNNKIDHLTTQKRTLGTRIRGHRIEGIVGYEFLKHFRLLFDYSAGEVALLKPAT